MTDEVAHRPVRVGVVARDEALMGVERADEIRQRIPADALGVEVGLVWMAAGRFAHSQSIAQRASHVEGPTRSVGDDEDPACGGSGHLGRGPSDQQPPQARPGM